MSINCMEKKIKIDGFNLCLSIWEGKGRDVFCVHGISSNSRVWNTIAESLKDKFNFIGIDLRGRGHSGAPGGYSLKNHVEDIKKVLQQLNIDKVILMGHSLGAYICIMFAAIYPEFVEKIVLFDGGGKLSPEQSEKVFEGIKPSLERLGKVYESFDEYIEHMKKAPFLQPWYEPMNEYYRYELEELDNGKVKSRVKPETIIEEIENLKNIDISDYYGRIKCPVYILRATEGMMSDNDHLLPEDVLKNMTNAIPKSEVINIEGTNHYTIAFYPNENREKVLRRILM